MTTTGGEGDLGQRCAEQEGAAVAEAQIGAGGGWRWWLIQLMSRNKFHLNSLA